MEASAEAIVDIVKVFLEDLSKPRCGAEICKRTGRRGSQVYPLIGRLHGQGLLVEVAEPLSESPRSGRPRIWYRPTRYAAVHMPVMIESREAVETYSAVFRPATT
jgi:hypothetical protein